MTDDQAPALAYADRHHAGDLLPVRPGNPETLRLYESMQSCGVHYAANATASSPFAGRKPG
jgi:hypothetical protein